VVCYVRFTLEEGIFALSQLLGKPSRRLNRSSVRETFRSPGLSICYSGLGAYQTATVWNPRLPEADLRGGGGRIVAFLVLFHSSTCWCVLACSLRCRDSRQSCLCFGPSGLYVELDPRPSAHETGVGVSRTVRLYLFRGVTFIILLR